MNAGVLNFALGLQNAGFNRALAGSENAVNGFTKQTAVMASGIERGSGEFIGMRERIEILRHSLDGCGGSFGALGGLARLALDPMTLGFAAAFAAVELFNRSLEASQKKIEVFFKEASGVEAIVKGILEARPSATSDWVELVEQIGKMGEKLQNVKTLQDAFNDMNKGIEGNTNDAADEQLEIEQKKIELLRDQGKISRADAAARIEALKDQAVLQKNLAERTGIQNEIGRRQSDLTRVNQLASRTPDEATATVQKQAADNKVADLKKQLEDLPKAIAANQGVISSAMGMSKGTKNVPEKESWYALADRARDRNTQLQASLGAAQSQFPDAVKAAGTADENLGNAKNYKSRSTELTGEIASLGTKLGVTMDRQRKMTPKQFEVNHLDAMAQGVTNMPMHKTGNTSLEKMGFVMGGPTASPMRRSEDLLSQILNATKANKPKAGGGGGGIGDQDHAL
jgi:hypothetical protein